MKQVQPVVFTNRKGVELVEKSTPSLRKLGDNPITINSINKLSTRDTFIINKINGKLHRQTTWCVNRNIGI